MNPLPRRQPQASWDEMAARPPAQSEFDAFKSADAPDERFSADRLRRVKESIELIPDAPDT
ncbi:hypothetical protein [Streptomyces sp. NBC_00233]|uniref:hypothetical protein n=1 Tax=Streptomyces sp. NBC_00233 TaxID=2975686 RepID=UPI00224CED67|nr:hypothetical protein [Streptomyces sp. NBC_00233]MCX5231471.1 hypothetical protein [Streptomyces sp. NBC_00233]MCX5233145.1 hypothetical protein [Streptomyces sp. NBC_00233]MCX5233587.1 hypothetical protein [Streptomyces sp. NBC_00233]